MHCHFSSKITCRFNSILKHGTPVHTHWPQKKRWSHTKKLTTKIIVLLVRACVCTHAYQLCNDSQFWCFTIGMSTQKLSTQKYYTTSRSVSRLTDITTTTTKTIYMYKHTHKTFGWDWKCKPLFLVKVPRYVKKAPCNLNWTIKCRYTVECW